MISNDPVLASSVRILDANSAVIGTGFVVSIFRDNTHALVLTSTSNIEHAVSQPIYTFQGNVSVTFHADPGQQIWEASIVDGLPSDVENVCTLVIQGKEKLPPRLRTLPLSLSTNLEGRQVSIFGYPEIRSSHMEGSWRYCEICRLGPRHRLTDDWFLQLEIQDLPDGYKGAPIWDDVHRHVLGMITYIEHPSESELHHALIYATPVEVLYKLYQYVLRKHISELSIQFESPSPFHHHEPYTEGEGHIFFGYEDVTERIKHLLDTHPKFLTILGPEKSGKTSVIQAGLIPRLKNAVEEGHPRYGIFKARITSQEPLQELQQQGLHGASSGMREAVHRWCQTYGYTGIFIILDQFEDFLRACPLEIQNGFIEQLLDLAEEQTAIVIIALRDEFYSLLARHEGLMHLVERTLVNVFAPRQREQLLDILQKSTERTNAGQSSQQLSLLIDQVLENIETEQIKQNNPLARINHYLSLEEQYRKTNQASRAEARVATVSLSDWAEELYLQLDERQQQFLKHLLLQFVASGNETLGVPNKKHYVPIEQLCTNEEENDLVERLIDQCFLVTNRDRQRGLETVTIAQDELIHEWSRLRLWLDEKRQFIIWQDPFQRQLQAWVHSHIDVTSRNKDLLLQGAALALAEAWLKVWPAAFSARDRLFIETSQRQQESAALRLQDAYDMAERQRKEIERRHAEVLSLYLIHQARQLYQEIHHKQQGIQLAAAAASLFPSPESDNVLREALALLPRKIASVTTRYPIQFAALSHTGRYAVVYKDKGTGKSENLRGEVGDLKGERGELKRLEWQFGLYHETNIRLMAMSPDGAYLAISETDGKVYLCFLGEKEETKRELLEYDTSITEFLFSPKGKYLAIICWDGYESTIKIKECATLAYMHVSSYQSHVTSVAFSGGESILGVGYADGLVKMFLLGHKGEISEQYAQNHDRKINAIALSRTAAFLAIALENKEVRVVRTGVKGPFHGYRHKDQIRFVAFSPDDRYVISGGDDVAVKIYDLARESELKPLVHNQTVCCAAFSSDSVYLAIAGRDDTIKIWDAHQSFQPWMEFSQQGTIHGMAFSLEKHYLFSAGNERDICIWDIAKSAHCTLLPRKLSARAKTPVHTLLWEPNTANYALIVASKEKPPEIWNFREGYDLYDRPFPYKKAVQSILYSPDNKYLATVGYDQAFYLWHSLSDEQPRRIHHRGTIRCFAWSSDGHHLAIGGSGGNANCSLWDIPSGQKLKDFPHASLVSAITFSNDGHLLITGCESGEVRIWKKEEEQRHSCTPAHTSRVNALAVSLRGSYLATTGEDGSLFIWDCEGNRRYNLPARGRINALQFDPSERYLVVAYADHQACIWNTIDGSLHQTLSHQGAVNSIAISSDGQYVMTGSDDCRVGIWNMDVSQHIASLEHNDGVVVLALSPDNKYVAAGCRDGTVKIWLWHPEQLIREAMSRIVHILAEDEWHHYARNEPYEMIAHLLR